MQYLSESEECGLFGIIVNCDHDEAKIMDTKMNVESLAARLRRLYSAHERADWKLDGRWEGLRRSRKARKRLADEINTTEEALDAVRGW